MDFRYDSLPVPGHSFSVEVIDFRGGVLIEIFIGGLRVATKECPDPPCHEMLFIPKDADGKTLRIVATGKKHPVQQKSLILGVGSKPYL